MSHKRESGIEGHEDEEGVNRGVYAHDVVGSVKEVAVWEITDRVERYNDGGNEGPSRHWKAERMNNPDKRGG